MDDTNLEVGINYININLKAIRMLVEDVIDESDEEKDYLRLHAASILAADSVTIADSISRMIMQGIQIGK